MNKIKKTFFSAKPGEKTIIKKYQETPKQNIKTFYCKNCNKFCYSISLNANKLCSNCECNLKYNIMTCSNLCK